MTATVSAYTMPQGMNFGAQVNNAMLGGVYKWWDGTPVAHWPLIYWEIIGAVILTYIVFWIITHFLV